MRWGIGLALLSVVVVGLGAGSGEARAQIYEPVPEYTPVEPPPRSPAIDSAIPAPSPPPNVFSVRRVKRVWANGRAIIFVRVFAPGRVFVWGRGIRTIARGAAQPRVVRVPIKPKSRLRRWLRRHGKGRIRVKIAFRPHGGIAREPRERPVLLRKKRRRR